MVTATLYCDACGMVNRREARYCISCGQSLQAISSLLQSPAAGAAMSFPTGHLAPNHLLKQRYRILKQLGQGGMGIVYKSEDVQFGNRLMAIKEMSQDGLRPEEIADAREAFKREALMLAGLMHPHLPRTYDHFFEGGRWYLVMDFIDGQTLEEYLSKANGGYLPLEEVLDIGIQLCTILGYLHFCQPPIIFRDLKPANVMLTPDKHIYLFDFGIARHFKPGQTRDTAIFGSMGYAAPEQYGKAQTTPRSDIYSLGATLHQLLSGSDPAHTPFLFKPLRLQHQPPPIELDELIMQMVDVNESRRPASMVAIKQELQRIALQRATGQGGNVQPKGGVIPPLQPQPATIFPTMGTTLTVYRGHSGRVLTLAWSHNGKHVASGGYDTTVQIWYVTTGDKLFTYYGHAEWVKALAWSPDDSRVASAGADGTVQIWDALTGLNVLNYREHTNIVSTLAWSPDGKRIASGGYDKTVHLWDATTGERLFTYHDHSGIVNTVAWSPDGTLLASASDDHTVQVWKPAHAQTKNGRDAVHLFTYYGHTDKVSAVAWSPNGKRIASGSWDNTVQVWDALSGGYTFIHCDHSSWINAVAWSPNGKLVASASNDQTVQVWDASTGREYFSKRGFYTYYGHTEWVRDVTWSPDGQFIASGGHDGTVRVWQAT